MQTATNIGTLTSLTALVPALDRFGLNQQKILNFGLEKEMRTEPGRVAVLSDQLQAQGEPLGELLAYRFRLFAEPDNKAMRRAYDEKLTGLVRKVLETHGVPNGLVGVSMDHGLKLAFNIASHTPNSDKKNVLSAISELTNSGLALLSETNEQGYLVRQMGPVRMVRIPEGRFVMGAADFEDAPPHWVKTQPYWLGETVLTEGAYRLLVEAGGNSESEALYPANRVNWHDAQAYCESLNQSLPGLNFGLPTEAQWERGARGPAVNMWKWMKQHDIKASDFAGRVQQRDERGRLIGVMENFYAEPEGDIHQVGTRAFRALLQSGKKFWGSPMFGTGSGRLNVAEAYYNQESLTQVGRYAGNRFGVQGMTGEVWEWVNDWYNEMGYGNGESMRQDPRGPKTGDYRSLRGGSWIFNHSVFLRVAFRYYGFHPTFRNSGIGVRLAAAPQDS